MGNLIRMDLYRMRKARSFMVCLILSFVISACQTPLAWMLINLGRMFSNDVELFPATANLTEIIANPFPALTAMLLMLSACNFFYADMENGYIKNIAGQMPKRGFTILSKFIAAIPHNLLFMLLNVAGNLIGTMFLQRIVVGGDILNSIGAFCLKFLLIQSICAILLLVTATCRSKSLGSVLSVLLGTGLMVLVYSAITEGINQVLHLKGFSLSNYMPDQLLLDPTGDTLTSILSAAVTTAIFLPLSIRIFDRRDVK